MPAVVTRTKTQCKVHTAPRTEYSDPSTSPNAFAERLGSIPNTGGCSYTPLSPAFGNVTVGIMILFLLKSLVGFFAGGPDDYQRPVFSSPSSSSYSASYDDDDGDADGDLESLDWYSQIYLPNHRNYGIAVPGDLTDTERRELVSGLSSIPPRYRDAVVRQALTNRFGIPLELSTDSIRLIDDSTEIYVEGAAGDDYQRIDVISQPYGEVSREERLLLLNNGARAPPGRGSPYYRGRAPPQWEGRLLIPDGQTSMDAFSRLGI